MSQRPDPQTLAAAFSGTVHASPAEVAMLARHLVRASNYLEFGAGGSTRMALAAGIGRLTSIETDRGFRDRLAGEPEIAPHIAAGRLRLVHADIGPTENWGYPIAPPDPLARARFLGWAWRARGVDTAFVDGRFRVAAAAAISVASPRATILIHDYASRPGYHDVEDFLERIETSEDMSAFRSRNRPARALAALARHRRDVE